jgi:bacteriocin biosynthesis cyclodehydratase domain-containing protein
VERTLASLLERRPLEQDPETRAVLDTLERRGCLVAEDERDRRARDRGRGRVSVRGDLAGAQDLLIRAGVRVVADGSPVDATLVICRGELAREVLDPLIRAGTPHVVVRLVDGSALIGPFVVPGVTACLRCVDAHQSIGDPDHVPVTNRYVRATARARADGVPDVTDPVLANVAVAWAVRDVVAHLEGRRPATWSRTLVLDDDPSSQREAVWPRHPECGCCWSAHTLRSGKIGE